MPDSAETFASGDRVAGYQILGLAGAGGMGMVYRALDVKLQRAVALKFLPHELTDSPADKERFLREARTASSLDHPNIGVIHGIEESADGRTFIVMAFYEGETLARKIMRGPLPIDDVVRIATQVAHGLGEAHAHAIVHRDIKPSNIILTQQNLAKVVDFGLARGSALSASTQSMGTAGTLGYMSPEQTLGKPLDQRSDIWSLGVVMTEMITGKNPFWRETAPATIFAILNEAPRPIENAPLELQRIIYRTLSKDAATRYASCREVAGDLELVSAQLKTSTTSTSGSRLKTALRQDVEHASRPMWLPGTHTGRKTWYWPAMLGLLAGLLAAGTLVVPSWRERVFALFRGRTEHVAVLPLDTVGQDAISPTVSDGLIESLTSRLSTLEVDGKTLWVVPASEVRRQKVNDPTTARLALGATLVVKGSIARSDKDIRLTMNLIDATSLRQVGSVSLEDRAGDLGSLQDEAVADLARLMHLNITAGMLRDTGGVVAPAAYERYLEALGYLQRYDKPGNIDQAIAALNEALKTDARFALGYAALGKAYQLKYVVNQDPRWIEEASANCRKALELDSSLAAPYVTLGRIHDEAGQYDLAAQEFQRALDLNARDADALNGKAIANERAGRKREAEDAFKKAIALRSDSWDGFNTLGLFYDREGRYPEAVAEFQKAIALTPDNAQVYSNLAAALVDMSDDKVLPQAEAALRKSIALSPSYPAYANLGMLYSQQKRYAESATATEKALQLDDKNYRVWENLAIAYEGAGDRAKAASAREREMALVEALVKVKPKDGELQSYLALLYGQKKQAEQAVRQAQTALALAGDNQVVLENVAEMYEHLGERTSALRYMASALQKGYPMESLKTNPAMRDLLADPNFHVPGK